MVLQCEYCSKYSNFYLDKCEGCCKNICDDCSFIVDKNDRFFNELLYVPLCNSNVCINTYLKNYKINQLNSLEYELKCNKNEDINAIIEHIKNIKLEIELI